MNRIKPEHIAYAKRRGISRELVYQRVEVLKWPIERAIRERVRGEMINTEDEFFGGASSG